MLNEKKTEQTVGAAKTEGKSKAQMKKESFAIIKELVDKQSDPKYKDALAKIRPSLYGIATGGGSSSAMSKFIDFLTEKKSVSEDEVFKQFKMGRKECASIIRKSILKVEPENRVWISFDPKTGTYKLEGKGKDAPANWQGYRPAENKVTLNKDKGLK